MSVELETLPEKIFALLKGHDFDIKIYNETGDETVDPKEARRFFVVTPNMMVTIDEEDSTVEISKAQNDKTLLPVQQTIRKLADQALMNTRIQVFGKSIQPRDFAYQAKIKKGESMMEDKMIKENVKINSLMLSKVFNELDYAAGMTAQALADNIPGADLNEVQGALNLLVDEGKVEVISYQGGTPVYGKAMIEALNEGFSRMFGTAKTSRQVLENVRIMVRHKIPVDESVPGARSRHISAIFLECNGERFRFPYNYLPGARAMAQHLAHGGQVSDKVGSYITENVGNLVKLQSFNRYVTTNKLINEDSSGIVETIKENIDTIRTELKKLTGVKTYESVRARIETYEREQLAEDDISQLKDLFTIRRFDEKLEEVLPIVKQLIQEKDTYHKRIEEAAALPVSIKRTSVKLTPVLEFANENARLGYKIRELSNLIVENQELAEFINRVGTKITKSGNLDNFEKTVVAQVLENLRIYEGKKEEKNLKESQELDLYFDKYITRFI